MLDHDADLAGRLAQLRRMLAASRLACASTRSRTRNLGADLERLAREPRRTRADAHMIVDWAREQAPLGDGWS